jgi:hypothetical protein
MSEPQKYICDCGEHYSSAAALLACTANNHGNQLSVRRAAKMIADDLRKYPDVLGGTTNDPGAVKSFARCPTCGHQTLRIDHD